MTLDVRFLHEIANDTSLFHDEDRTQPKVEVWWLRYTSQGGFDVTLECNENPVFLLPVATLEEPDFRGEDLDEVQVLILQKIQHTVGRYRQVGSMQSHVNLWKHGGACQNKEIDGECSECEFIEKYQD